MPDSQGDSRVWRRAAALASAALLVVWAFYTALSYRELEALFLKPAQRIPTRFYSDAQRFAPPDPRADIESALRARGIPFEPQGDLLRFHPRAPDFPLYLLPDRFDASLAARAGVTLEFDGDKPDSSLRSVRMGDKEAQDFFLEPELVATLSRGAGEQREIRTIAKFADIPSSVWKAILAVEDPGFLEHRGLDPRGIARALWVDIKTLSLAQGGSTITNQLVKNLRDRRDKNLLEKAHEILLALLLEARFSKEEILERYLNEVYLGQVGSLEVRGVAEGAQLFFGKRLEDLNLSETALMAGLIRGPFYYSPYKHWDRVIERQRFVLKRMVETGQLAEEEIKVLANAPIRLAPPLRSTNKAPFFVDFARAELIRLLRGRMTEEAIAAGGFRVYTTLDSRLNAIAQDSVASGVSRLEKSVKPGLEGALIAVEQGSGAIRALVGGKDYAASNFNRVLNMKRQVGSTFKPVVYLAALLRGTDGRGAPFGPAYPMEDAPWKLRYDRGKQLWSPRNYEKGHLSWIPLRTALAASVNTIAARLGVEVGIDSVVDAARALGIDSDLPKVPSLSLGVAELSPVELARMYSAISNHGISHELIAIRGVTLDDGTGFERFGSHPRQAVPAGAADLLADMLGSVISEGTARAAHSMGLDRPAAGKTGTTSHHRDAWFAGFTPYLTAVVWVGMDQDPGGSKPAKGVALTGSSSALPIWVDFVRRSHEGVAPIPFPESPNLTSVRFDRMSGRFAAPDCPDSSTLVDKFWVDRPTGEPTCSVQWPASKPEVVAD